MTEKLTLFDTAESERRYMEAYSAALSLWPIPFKEQWISTRFGDTHVIVSGTNDASPLVLFHPAGCGSVIWYRNVKELSKSFKTFAVDTVGEVNKSTIIQPLRSQNDLLVWVGELFQGLQIIKADIIGNSFGGYISTLTAVHMPEVVKRAVLISPAATFMQMWPWIWHFFPAYMSGSKRLKSWAYDWIWQDFAVDDCIAEMRVIASTSGMPKHAGPKVLKDDELRRIRAPVLLLIGDHEVIYSSTRVIERARRLVRNLSAEIVPNANHNAEYTAAEDVNAKVASFLSS
jgi:pimeloyl-ACP methyl ester carboxylesterase